MADSMMKRAYHVETGAKEMYAVDANKAVAEHPDEWAWLPFSASERDNYRAARIERHKKETEEAAAAGLPPPPPLVLAPVVEPTDAKKSEMDADTKARAEAAEVVRVAEEKERKEQEEVQKVSAAKALLQSPPPEPDPNERRPVPPPERRPVGRPTNAEMAARAAAEKAAADKEAADAEARKSPPKK
jgi:colicin import membrane protein